MILKRLNTNCNRKVGPMAGGLLSCEYRVSGYDDLVKSCTERANFRLSLLVDKLYRDASIADESQISLISTNKTSETLKL